MITFIISILLIYIIIFALLRAASKDKFNDDYK